MARIKGGAMLDTVRWIRKFQKERARALLDPRLHRYLEERILVSEWYSDEDYRELMRVIVSLMAEAKLDVGGEPYAFIGRLVAKEYFAKFYDHLIDPGGPEATMRSAPVWWLTYHDTGRLHVGFPRARSVRLELSGYSSPWAELCQFHKGLYSELLRMSGAREVRVAEPSCCARGDPSCVLELDWK